MASQVTFRNAVFDAVLDREPTADEARTWRTALNCSVAIGDLVRLAFDSGNLITGVFLSTEYADRDRTNSEFIDDVFAAFFARSASGGEVTTWTAYLGSHSRAEMLGAFAADSEFSDRTDTVSMDLTGSIDSYPTPEFGGPRPSKETESPADFSKVTSVIEFQDGGRSFSTSADRALRSFTLDYQWFDLGSEAKKLDDHRNASFEVLSFTFIDRFGNTHLNCYYDTQGMDKDHRTIDDPIRTIRLIKLP